MEIYVTLINDGGFIGTENVAGVFDNFGDAVKKGKQDTLTSGYFSVQQWKISKTTPLSITFFNWREGRWSEDYS